jgi:protein SCO1
MPPRSRLVAISAAAVAAVALAVAALLGSSAGGSGRNSGGTTESSPAGFASATGYEGALLPANLAPREFTLTDQYGRTVSLRDLRGRVAILAFLYSTSRATAPLIAQQIRGALDELEPHSSPPALAVSVDPAADTPGNVRAFLRHTSLTGRLRYLTGTPARLRAVWRAYRVVPAAADETAYERSAFVLVLGKNGAPRVELPLEELTPEGLAHDVRRLEGAAGP